MITKDFQVYADIVTRSKHLRPAQTPVDIYEDDDVLYVGKTYFPPLVNENYRNSAISVMVDSDNRSHRMFYEHYGVGIGLSIRVANSERSVETLWTLVELAEEVLEIVAKYGENHRAATYWVGKLLLDEDHMKKFEYIDMVGEFDDEEGFCNVVKDLLAEA